MAMKARTALALVAVAIVAAVRFWPDDLTGPPTAHSAPEGASQRDSSTKPSDNTVERPAQKAPVDAGMAPPQTNTSAMLAGLSGTPVRIAVRAPSKVHSGESFQVTVDVEATRVIRQIAFSVDFSATIMQLAGSSPGVFAQKSVGAGFFAEESSDGALLVRVDLDNGGVVGTGSVAVLEFRAMNPGDSPLTIHSVSYLESGHQDSSTTPAGYEGTITVD
ncbi:MAG TPA: cohesin domain-containing protein [Casimicrobiaceae bacterium]|jgi:hypothetical protein|nr:cohesin domain-containing protein [Casimicrobiaceae bacterium]